MDLNRFISKLPSASIGALHPGQVNQSLSDEVRDLARLGLKIFPVSLAAKLDGCPDRLIAQASDDLTLIEELSATARPIWGFRVALRPSGLCMMVLDGPAGRSSLARCVPDLEECFTLRGRRGDAAFAFFWKTESTQQIASALKLAPGVRIRCDGASLDLPPSGGAVWVNPGADIEVLPYSLRKLLESELPESSSGRRMLIAETSSSCRSYTSADRGSSHLR